LPKGGIPLFGKEGVGEISEEYVWSIMDSLVSDFYSRNPPVSNQAGVIFSIAAIYHRFISESSSSLGASGRTCIGSRQNLAVAFTRSPSSKSVPFGEGL